MNTRVLNGSAASWGMAYGRAVLLPSLHRAVPRTQLKPEHVVTELKRLDQALKQSRDQIINLIEGANLEPEYRGIFEAQLLLLEDPMILDEVRANINGKYRNCEWVLLEVVDSFKKKLAQLDDVYIQERASDLEDVGNRLLSNLMGVPEGDIRIPLLQDLPADTILVADEISPSLMLHVTNIAGIATENGGVTGHLAILARNRGIPSLVGVSGLMSNIREGVAMMLDAGKGELYIDPGPAVVQHYEDFRAQQQAADAHELIPKKVFKNGDVVRLFINVDDPVILPELALDKISGIGLFRTEFLYIKNPSLIGDDEAHFLTYYEILRELHEIPVVFRLIDVDEDKILDVPSLKLKLNKGVGLNLRGIAFLLAEKELLKNQLRAIMRAAMETNYPAENCRIMLPMVTTGEEIYSFNVIMAEIRSENMLYPELPVGIMLETPAACLMADVFSGQADFFSLGTNDLARSVLVRDRMHSSSVENQMLEPALYRMIYLAVQKATVPISICGEIAGVPELIPLLISLGVRDFSVSPSSLTRLCGALDALEIEDCLELAEPLLKAIDVSQIQELL